MYREWQGRVGGVTVWTRAAAAGGSQEYRVLPDGCMDLIWRDGALLVAGPDTAAYVAEESARTVYAGLRFAPGQGPRLLRVPAREVRDRRVPLDALWPSARARRLAERAEHDPAAALESWAAARTRELDDPAAGRTYPGLAAALERGSTVAEVAARSGLGERQLRRHCEAVFGYGPKTLARVLRFQRALALARTGTAFAQVAVEAGYADQPHLAREVRALTGVPLGRLLGGQGVLPSSAEGAAAPAAAKRSTPLPSGSWTTA